jgi:N-acyl-D-aspartate/D-glutamate deacylase
MKALLDQSLTEGALGFSSTISVSHNDGDGNPVPSRWADHSEIVELGRVVSRHEGTGLELLPDINFAPEVKELMANLSIAGQRAVNWNTLQLTDQPGVRERLARQLGVTDYARARGGDVLALTVPVAREVYVNFRTGMLFDINPGLWREIFKIPPEARVKTLRDPETRKRLQADADTVPADSVYFNAANIARYMVVSAKTEKNKKYEGRRICDIAQDEKRAFMDVILDIVVEDDLDTVLSPDLGGQGREAFELRGQLWHDDRTLVGASDAGAHMDMIDTFAFSTVMLEKGVREHRVISLEEAVYQLTHRLAKYMGLRERGLLKPGYHADIVVFDAATVGRAPTYARYDVPGNQYRLYSEAHGVDHVFVNGVQIIRDAQHTGKLPGKVLRSGKDTMTVPIGAMREGRTADFNAA